MNKTYNNDRPLSQIIIFRAWIPLAIMWILMAVEQPLINGFIARMPQAKLELAAFGITFAIALFIESPVIQLLAAATALSDSRKNYEKLLQFMHIMAVAATLFQIILVIPGVFRFFSVQIMGIPPELTVSTRNTLLFMMPWAAAVGYRRLWQGVLIRYGRNNCIPVTMTVRITVSVICLITGYRTGLLSGAVLGGFSLSAGVMAGAFSAWLYVRNIPEEMPESSENEDDLLTWGKLLRFYIPLGLTNFINLGIRPLLNMGLARGYLPLESLALWPVLLAYLFMFTSFSLSTQEVVISLLEGPESFKGLRKFIQGIAAILGIVYAVVIFSPVWKIWFMDIGSLPEDLMSLVPLNLLLLFPVIVISPFTSWFRGRLVYERKTIPITHGVGINAAVILTVLTLVIMLTDIPAVTGASMAFSLAFIAEISYLFHISSSLTIGTVNDYGTAV